MQQTWLTSSGLTDVLWSSILPFGWVMQGQPETGPEAFISLCAERSTVVQVLRPETVFFPQRPPLCFLFSFIHLSDSDKQRLHQPGAKEFPLLTWRGLSWYQRSPTQECFVNLSTFKNNNSTVQILFTSLFYSVRTSTAKERTTDLTVIPMTIISTLNKEGKPQKVIAGKADCLQSTPSKQTNGKLNIRERCVKKASQGVGWGWCQSIKSHHIHLQESSYNNYIPNIESETQRQYQNYLTCDKEKKSWTASSQCSKTTTKWFTAWTSITP